MDSAAAGPAVHYHMIRGGPVKKNITVCCAGMVGNEYIKTYGHYHIDDVPETYRILSGEGVLLLQTREIDSQGKPIDEKIASFRAIRVNAGDVITIPLRAGHLLANIGSSWLVTSDDSPFNAPDAGGDSAGAPRHADYTPVKKMRGFAYYVIAGTNGQPELVKNPTYASVPDAQIENYSHE